MCRSRACLTASLPSRRAPSLNGEPLKAWSRHLPCPQTQRQSAFFLSKLPTLLSQPRLSLISAVPCCLHPGSHPGGPHQAQLTRESWRAIISGVPSYAKSALSSHFAARRRSCVHCLVRVQLAVSARLSSTTATRNVHASDVGYVWSVRGYNARSTVLGRRTLSTRAKLQKALAVGPQLGDFVRTSEAKDAALVRPPQLIESQVH